MADLPPIDFAGLAAFLLDRAATLVAEWLPAGYEEGGRWYVGDLDGSKGKSCNVNLKTGTWIDNGTDEKGGDLISLYAAIHNLNMGQAAARLMKELGMSRPGMPPPSNRAAPQHTPDKREPAIPIQPNAASVQAPAKKDKPRVESQWRAITPVPENAPKPTFNHFKRGDAEQTWAYWHDGKLLGYVCRFTDSDGDKLTMPYTWCVDENDPRGLQRWFWKFWDDPRPLYLAAGLLSADARLVPVCLVEGEKCAEAGHKLLGHEFDFVTWPGGGKSWAKADLSPLQGRIVYMWPDCDAQRERLTAEEKKAGVDASSKPLLPEHKQPGMSTMVKIGSKLMADLGCTVYIVPIPKPGQVGDGWDIADAIAADWDAAMVRNRIREAVPFVPPDDAARAKAAPTPPSAGAGDDDDADPTGWRSKLLYAEKGGIKAARENVVLALDGIPGLPGIPEVRGVIAYNEFTNDVVKLRDAPWRSPAGRWEEVDELLLGEWLVRDHWLPSMPRGTLEEAVRMVAFRQRYHPVREYLSGLVWDGRKRLSTWLRRACLAPEEWNNEDELQQYLARCGTWFLQAMCARAMTPGVKFDYMLILEGAQGMRKSTLLATLAGQWFSDTGLDLSNKDSYQQLQGQWLYEIGELDAFNKNDITAIKRFVASSADNFRASFDRRARPYPRQLVFGGTTNEDHYLSDPTGNRRFWPVRVTRLIDIDWVIANRDQLFAEAMARNAAGERMHPTHEEELQLFVPQQELRQVSNAIGDAVAQYVTRDAVGVTKAKFTLVDVLHHIGIGLEKLGPGKYHEKQAGAALRKLGWVEKRSSVPPRPWEWHRPKPETKPEAAPPAAANPSTGLTPGQPPEGPDDDCPF